MSHKYATVLRFADAAARVANLYSVSFNHDENTEPSIF